MEIKVERAKEKCIIELTKDELDIIRASYVITKYTFERHIDRYRQWLEDSDLTEDERADYEEEIKKCEQRIKDYSKILKVKVWSNKGVSEIGEQMYRE